MHADLFKMINFPEAIAIINKSPSNRNPDMCVLPFHSNTLGLMFKILCLCLFIRLIYTTIYLTRWNLLRPLSEFLCSPPQSQNLLYSVNFLCPSFFQGWLYGHHQNQRQNQSQEILARRVDSSLRDITQQSTRWIALMPFWYSSTSKYLLFRIFICTYFATKWLRKLLPSFFGLFLYPHTQLTSMKNLSCDEHIVVMVLPKHWLDRFDLSMTSSG